MAINNEGFGSIISGLEEGGGGGSSAVTYNGEDHSTILANRQGMINNGTSEGFANTQFSTAGEGGSIDGNYCGSLSGDSHNVQGSYSIVAGGGFNQILNTEASEADYNFIGGGQSNNVAGSFSSIVGGQSNRTEDEGSVSYFGFIGGGANNRIWGENTTLVGGIFNTIDGANGGFIGGGVGNYLSAVSNEFDNGYSVIGGGKSNGIFGQTNVVGGGQDNWVGGEEGDIQHSVIAGGEDNYIVDHHSVIGGGRENNVNTNSFGEDSGWQTIAGGSDNRSWGRANAIGGGFGNIIGNNEGLDVVGGVIAGGENNTIERGNLGFIGGGSANRLGRNDSEQTLSTSVITGGSENTSYGQDNFVGGGVGNRIGVQGEADQIRSVIVGGDANTVLGNYASIGGGVTNTINGNADYSAIPGGFGNFTSARFAVALGVQADARTTAGVTQAGGAFNGESGQRQKTTVVVRGDVQGPSAGALGSGGINGNTDTSQIPVPPSTSAFFRAECTARDSAGVSKVVILEGLVVMDDGGSMTDTLSTVATYELGSPPAEWDFSIGAVGGGFEILFTTGADSSYVKTVAAVDLTEVRHSAP